LNVHDALEFYVRDGVDPAAVIKAFGAASNLPGAGWPEMKVDWHIGQRWASAKDCWLDKDGVLTTKDGKLQDAFDISEEEIEDGEISPVDLTSLVRKDKDPLLLVLKLVSR